MAVTTQPADFQNANIVMAKSDAATNVEAIREITEWARTHGFVRSNEYHLSTARSGGTLYFLSPVYRLDDEMRIAAEADIQLNRQRQASMPETVASSTFNEAL